MPTAADHAPLPGGGWQWDIFCRVIDNHGDLGVCWRLSADLAERGHRVRLWVDDASALAWMAPDGHPRVDVRPWSEAPLFADEQPGDVVIEAFGCELPGGYQAALASVANGPTARTPLWLNLEYLSAQAYVERSHGLPSPVLCGPAKGLSKWFFYPGFTPRTGGLIREPSVPVQTRPTTERGTRRISLFCYEPRGLQDWLTQLSQGPVLTHLWVAAGRPEAAVRHSLPAGHRHGAALNLRYLPYLPQAGYDHLLRHCDLNIVRGEDSLVRAIWAGRPLIWHIYPQEDGAHHDKLDAFLRLSQAPDSLVDYHRRWNADQAQALPAVSPAQLHAWEAWALDLRQRLLGQPDLTTQLIAFVASKG